MNGNGPPKKRKIEEELPELEPRTYKLQRILGQGSYGTVYQAEVLETKEIVAIKSIKPVGEGKEGKPLYNRDGPEREVQLLKELNGHPNIVELKGAFYSPSEGDEPMKLNLVFEFLSDTLHRVIKHTNVLQKSMERYYVRLYSYQIFRGLAYMHGMGIMHCDLKPQNLLLDGKTHGLRICDFGTARRLAAGEKRAMYVCSRYFRAPEIIFGSNCYNTAIDLWSAGCIVAEMIMKQPLFTGRDGIDQVVEIIKVLGTPTMQDLRGMNPNYPEYEFQPMVSARPWKMVLREWASAEEQDLISKLVRYDPVARLPPLQALLHPYFDELRKQEKEHHRVLFQFMPDELLWCTKADRAKLIPPFYRVDNPWM